LYARFYTKLLRDEGLVTVDEPFKHLLTQGMVLKDGAKMSKSKGNTVDPQGLIDQYGADTVRLFVMFAAPPEQSLEWSDSGVEGAYRFLKRLWRQVYLHSDAGVGNIVIDQAILSDQQKHVRRQLHQTISKVTDDIGRRFTFNTAIAANMELINTISKFTDDSELGSAIRQEVLEAIILMLMPIVPHVCQKLATELGMPEAQQNIWPVCDQSALIQDSMQIIVQVNGKLRSKIEVAVGASKELIEQMAINDEKVQKFLTEKSIKKVIVIPNKLINIVVA
jgi:leucyl-tRNA synthetase